jgi:hypothetical protein
MLEHTFISNGLMYYVSKQLYCFCLVRPTVTVYPSDAVCVLGQPNTFKCDFTGIPSPRVQWYHNNGTTIRPVPSTPKYTRAGYTLTVTSVSVQDEGTFVCKGINVAGSVNTSAYLNVQGKR